MASTPTFQAQGRAAQRYSELIPFRQPYLFRAIRCSGLTVFNLFRPQGSTGTTDTINPWQNFGALCLNTLSARVTNSAFPSGIAFIRLNPSKQALKDISQIQDPEQRATLKMAIQKGLSEAEKQFTDAVNEDGDIAVLTTGTRYLLAGGNHGFWMYQDGTLRGIPFDRYVVCRDQQGNPLEWVIEDNLAFPTLPDDVKAFIREKRITTKAFTTSDPNTKDLDSMEQNIKLYTHGYLGASGKWEVYQECMGETIPGTEWSWAKEYCPFIPATLDLLPGEHYARSYVENYEGDLQLLDGLTETLTEGTAAAAQLIRLVRPGGVTNKKALADARNGAILTGDPADVATLDTNKAGDFSSVETRLASIEQRLGRAFMVTSRRNGERVTAEEIRQDAQELNDSLGGTIYTGVTTSIQTPYARLKMAALMRSGRMTPLPKNLVRVMLVTGAAALGRGAEIAGLDALVNVPAGVAPFVQQVINPSMYFQRRATALQVDQEGLVLTQEEIDAKQQAAMQQQQMLQATGPLINQGGALLKGAQDHASAMAQQQAEADQQTQQQGPTQ